MKIKLILSCILISIVACSTDNPLPDEPEISEEKEEKGVVPPSQSVILNIENYKHQFVGGGVSIGLFMGHQYSMGAVAQDKAIQLIAKNCNMKYLQDYIQIYPKDDPAYFDRRADYVKAAKVYRPEIEFSLVGNKFPDDLLREITVEGEQLQVLDTDDSEIYNRLALWFFELFKGFDDRGVSVEILNVVNEPDLNRTFRKYHYGLDGDTKEAVARIFKYAVPKFKEMLNDPNINTSGMKVPLIMGPSTISPVGCLEYIDFFKSEHPDVWNDIDIVATHQYENGANVQLFQNIVDASEGKEFHQSETHALKGDAIGFVTAERPLKAALSLSNLFGTAVRNGVSSWYYFENNYPDDFHPGGLLSVPWNAPEPKPYKHYYAFQQLTSTQPDSSYVLGYQNIFDQNSEITVFRQMEQDTIYMNYSNYDAKPRNISIVLNDGGNTNFKIGAHSVITTDKENNAAVTNPETYATPLDTLKFTTSGHSVNTLKITIANP